MRQIIPLNDSWEFTQQFDERFPGGASEDFQTVRLPHTCQETPFDYFDESVYQMDCGYRRRVAIPPDAQGKRIFLTVEAAGHSAQVYVDGQLCGPRHNCGYTAFTVELTDRVTPGAEALIAIEVNSRESQEIPPFGHVIDYMTYGGLYREVRLEIRDRSHIADVFAKPSLSGKLESEIAVEGDADTVRQSVFLKDVRQCWQEFPVGAWKRALASVRPSSARTAFISTAKRPNCWDSTATRVSLMSAMPCRPPYSVMTRIY